MAAVHLLSTPGAALWFLELAQEIVQVRPIGCSHGKLAMFAGDDVLPAWSEMVRKTQIRFAYLIEVIILVPTILTITRLGIFLRYFPLPRCGMGSPLGGQVLV